MTPRRFGAEPRPDFRDSRQETMFNQVFEKLLSYAAGSGMSSGQHEITAFLDA